MRVYEIFNSIDGEVNAWGQGTIATFVRLDGCNLKCSYCFGSPPGRRQPYVILSQGSKKKLKDVEEGDTILTYDEEFNIVETKVIKAHSRKVDKWLRITIDGIQYFVTHEHPFMTPEGIIKAEALKIGDDIYQVLPKNIISFKKSGDRNPMKQKAVSLKVHQNRDYALIGKKISKTINKKMKYGTYQPPIMTEEGKKNLSEKRKGDKNPNWSGGSSVPNYEDMKKRIKNKDPEMVCSCKSTKYLEVHHIDENRENDNPKNLLVMCKSCHTKVHKKGYNFWNGNRRDGKQLIQAVGNNGKGIEAIKEFDRGTYPPSLTPKPLQVYNLTCHPYNTYFLDNMWVHNCDTPETQEVNEVLHEWSVMEVASAVIIKGCKKVVITGGEPLLQREDLKKLVNTLIDHDFNISIETNGTFFIPSWNVNWIADWKLHKLQDHANFVNLEWRDFIKFIIGNEHQYKLAVEKYYWLKLYKNKARIAFSPIDEISPSKLINWLLEDRLTDVVVNIQLHKLISVQ